MSFYDFVHFSCMNGTGAEEKYIAPFKYFVFLTIIIMFQWNVIIDVYYHFGLWTCTYFILE